MLFPWRCNKMFKRCTWSGFRTVYSDIIFGCCCTPW